jgi:hypothetical protein
LFETRVALRLKHLREHEKISIFKQSKTRQWSSTTLLFELVKYFCRQATALLQPDLFSAGLITFAQVYGQ